MSREERALPRGLGLWAGFLDRLAPSEAVSAAQSIERAGIGTIWLQEYSGVDPFVRAAMYLGATERLTVALGVATIHARDPEAMVAVATTLHQAFPDRFALGLGVSHRPLAEGRGGAYDRPLTAMRHYLDAMEDTLGRRVLPSRFLGALGPRMVELAGERTDGVHSYFAPIAHTAASRKALGTEAWIAPTQMVAIGAPRRGWHDQVRPYLGLCLGMQNYRDSLHRFGFAPAVLDAATDDLVEALIVSDDSSALRERIRAQRRAGADHVVVQFVPPPPAHKVLERIADGFGASWSDGTDR